MPIAIIATTIGGLGSIRGSFLGGVFCGIVQQVTALLWSSALQDVPSIGGTSCNAELQSNAVTCWTMPQNTPPRNEPRMLPRPPIVVAMMAIGISVRPFEGSVG